MVQLINFSNAQVKPEMPHVGETTAVGKYHQMGQYALLSHFLNACCLRSSFHMLLALD